MNNTPATTTEPSPTREITEAELYEMGFPFVS